MAKAVPIASPIETGDPQEWLVGVLRARFNEVIANHADALNESQIEGIHDMRVSIRRLRSVIRDFAEVSERYPLKGIRTDLKKLADKLGKVRDLDVAIQALERLANEAGDDEVSKGVASFIQRIRKKRVEEFEKLRPQLLPGPIERLSNRFEKTLNSALGQRSLFAAATIAEARAEIISSRVEDFVKRTDSLYDPNRIRQHHQLRIAAKHLRYAVELFESGEQAQSNGTAGAIAAMQSFLGEMHDCDVWIAEFERGLRKRKHKALTGPERLAAVWLISQFARRRTKAYRSALRLWSEWERDELLEQLKSEDELSAREKSSAELETAN